MLIDDCKLRKCPGIMLIHEDTEIGPTNFQKLKEHDISVIEFKPDEKGNYFNKDNMIKTLNACENIF